MHGKKIFVLAMAIGLVLTMVFSGCSDRPGDDDSEIVSLNVIIDGVDEDAEDVKVEVDGFTIEAGDGFNTNYEKDNATEIELKVIETGDYEFDGWRYSGDDESFKSDEEIIITMDEDKNIVAQFGEKETYTVTFDNNDGDTEADPNEITVEEGESIDSLPTEPTRDGYKFVEWNTKANGDGDTFTTETEIIEDMTVYAIWEAEPEEDPEEQKITKVEELDDIEVDYGTEVEELGLADEVEVTLEDDSTTDVEVGWDTKEYDGEETDEYELTGYLVNLPEDLINPDKLVAEVKVTVGEEELPQIAEIDINDEVENITVAYGTSEEDAKNQLVDEIVIKDTDDEEHKVSLDWIIEDYESETADGYTATGTFDLPEGVEENSEIDLEVKVTVTVLETPSDNDNLSDLEIEPGQLDPEFDMETTEYNVDVDYDVETVDITAHLEDENATLEIDGSAVDTGEKESIELNSASETTEIEIKVIAEDGETNQIYSITVNRADEPYVDTVELSGAKTITIPSEVEAYSATVKDQYDEVMDDEDVNWSLADVNGSDVEDENVSIEDGELTVSAEASVQENSFKVIAKSQTDTDLSDELTISLTDEDSEVTSIEISGLESVIIPANGENTAEYEAEVKDQFGDTMADEEVSWEIDENITGISRDEAGKVTVNAEADAEEFTIVATSDSNDDISKSKVVALEADSVESIEIETQPELEYTEGDSLNLSEMKVKINWKAAEAEILDYPDDKLSADPEAGRELSVDEHNGETVTITYNGDESLIAETNELSVDKLMHTVTFDANQGEITEGDTTVEVRDGETVDEANIPGATKDGYKFVEWDTQSDASGDEFTTETKINDDMTVYAIWEEELADNANLSNLEIDPGELKPEFAAEELNYDVAVNYDVDTVDIKAELADENATLEIADSAVDDGQTKSINLNSAGESTEIEIKVTAEDGDTKQIYSITIKRAEEPEVDSIEISGPESVIIPANGENIAEYEAEVKDQFEDTMADEEVIWEIKEDITGISRDEAGKVTVTAEADAEEFTIVATSDSNDDISERKVVALEADSVESIEIETQPKLNYTEGENLDLSAMQVQINWEVAGAEILDYPDDKLSADPVDGTELAVDEHDGQRITVTYDEDESLTAETDKISVDKLMHTVTFDANGGEIDGDSTVEVRDGETVDGSNIPGATKKDHEFVKWNTQSDGEGDEFTSETVINDDITVYAIWEEESEDVDLDFGWETPPEAPENLKVIERDDNSIELDWKNAEDYPEGYIAGYAVYRSVNGGEEERIAQIEGEETGYIDDNDIEAANDYEYRVAAYNQDGYRSAKSEAVLSEGEQQEITFYYMIPEWGVGEALVAYYSQGDESGTDIEMAENGDWYTATVVVEDANAEIEFVLSFMGDDGSRKYLKATGDHSANMTYETETGEIWIDSTDISEWAGDDYYLDEEAYFDIQPE